MCHAHPHLCNELRALITATQRMGGARCILHAYMQLQSMSLTTQHSTLIIHQIKPHVNYYCMV